MSATRMQQYSADYMAAVCHTGELGVQLPPLQLVVRKNCVEIGKIAEVLNQVTEGHEVDELHARSIEFIIKAKVAILANLGIPFTLTGGWFEDGPRKVYQHTDEYLKRLINQGMLAGDFMQGIQLHFWLTSPAHEILDLFLAGMIARAMKLPASDPRARGVIYYANDKPDSDVSVIYHPTIVGEEFLEIIGAIIPAF